jgi:hypothetical protein
MDFRDLASQKDCAQCGAVFYRDKRCTWAHWERAKFCSRRCSAQSGVDRRRVSLADAFMAKAKIIGWSDCWGWLGSTDKDGYPLLTHNGIQYRATRVAITLSGRPLRDDDQACHSCGNSWCCNPGHLYAGSALQNANDKIEHGTHILGESIPWSKLTDEAVREIRRSGDPAKLLARRFGVSIGAIRLAKRGKTWGHVK